MTNVAALLFPSLATGDRDECRYFSDACNNLKDVIDHVVQNADVTVITRRDAPNAALMSLDYYNSLLETAHRKRTVIPS